MIGVTSTVLADAPYERCGLRRPDKGWTFPGLPAGPHGKLSRDALGPAGRFRRRRPFGVHHRRGRYRRIPHQHAGLDHPGNTAAGTRTHRADGLCGSRNLGPKFVSGVSRIPCGEYPEGDHDSRAGCGGEVRGLPRPSRNGFPETVYESRVGGRVGTAARPARRRSHQTLHELHAGIRDVLFRESAPFGSAGQKFPIRIALTENGSSCVVGCHRPRDYDRSREAGETPDRK